MAPKRKSGQVQQQQKQKPRKKAHKEGAPKLDPKDLYEASDSDAEEEKYAYKFDVSMPSVVVMAQTAAVDACHTNHRSRIHCVIVLLLRAPISAAVFATIL
jgi:hypothetical protein